jgi:hypothetical protein
LKPEELRHRLRPLARRNMSLRTRRPKLSASSPCNRLSLREYAVRKLKMLRNVRKSSMRKSKMSRELLRPLWKKTSLKRRFVLRQKLRRLNQLPKRRPGKKRK